MIDTTDGGAAKQQRSMTTSVAVDDDREVPDSVPFAQASAKGKATPGRSYQMDNRPRPTPNTKTGGMMLSSATEPAPKTSATDTQAASSSSAAVTASSAKVAVPKNTNS